MRKLRKFLENAIGPDYEIKRVTTEMTEIHEGYLETEVRITMTYRGTR